MYGDPTETTDMGGVTKPISSVPLFSEFLSIVKTNVSYCVSRLYLAAVAAAQLRWHLLNERSFSNPHPWYD